MASKKKVTKKKTAKKDTFKSLLNMADESKLGKGANVTIKSAPKKKKKASKKK